MKSQTKTIYQLHKAEDNPIFEGFGMASKLPSLFGNEELSDDLLPLDDGTRRDWKVNRFGRKWMPPMVKGRVRPFNDYPCIGLIIPAFSRRAVDALRDLLEPNGELLPLKSDVGEYYLFNILTVADVLDLKRSKGDYICDPPGTATDISYFAFHERKLKGLSIFRLVDLTNYVFVTDVFYDRVIKHGLNGFEFMKVWPYTKGVDWEAEHDKVQRRNGSTVASVRGRKGIKANTLVLIFSLTKEKPSPVEKKIISRYQDELDAQLLVPTLTAPYFGSLEGHEFVKGVCHLFLSCPDVDALVVKIRPWLDAMDWPRKVQVLKRYGGMYDEDASEEHVKIVR